MAEQVGLTAEQVRHIATLARVGMSPEEVERFRVQLSTSLEHFQVLREVDTDGVPPTGHAIALTSVMRQDEAVPSFPKGDILASAPRREEGLFRVKAVLEES